MLDNEDRVLFVRETERPTTEQDYIVLQITKYDLPTDYVLDEIALKIYQTLNVGKIELGSLQGLQPPQDEESSFASLPLELLAQKNLWIRCMLDPFVYESYEWRPHL